MPDARIELETLSPSPPSMKKVVIVKIYMLPLKINMFKILNTQLKLLILGIQYSNKELNE